MNGWMDGCAGGWVGVRMDGLVGGWMDRSSDGWMFECMGL
jgi:hypothetical protein